MNCKVVALLAAFCALMLVDTEALRLRIRGRRIWRRVKKPLCRAACTYTCTTVTVGSAAPVCGLACREACNKKKRSADQFEVDSDKVVIPLPRDFDLYDTNRDEFIQVEELAEILSLAPTRSDVQKAFYLADSDDDALISDAEFDEAPWKFEDVDESAVDVADEDDE